MQNIKTLTLLSLALISTFTHGQTRCDTLFTKDGKHILVKQIHTRNNGIAYSKCGEMNGSEYFLEKSQLKEIRFQAPDSSLNNTNASSTSRSEVRTYSNLSRTTLTLWLGATLTDFSQDYYEGEELSWFQFGAQIGLKEKPIFLALMYHPSVYTRSYFDDFQTIGPNGDITLSVKVASRGRMTGRVSRAYLGADLQLGRQNYSYTARYNINAINKEIKRQWYTILIRPGIQGSFKWFTFDLALPFGIRTTTNRYDTGFYKTRENERTISIFPVAAVGIRF